MFDLIGKTVGPYRILEQAGAGGMATVYKAYQPNMDRYIAVKVLPMHLSKDPEFTKRFQREARAIARLEHAHILPVYDYGEYEGITYLAMRYIKAGTLKDRMSAGRLSLDDINNVISQIGSALDYAHRMGVIHRDIKPGNVLMDEQGDVYLSDFGLARMMEQSQQLTGSGVGLGTPAYMSPEQGQGNKIDHRTDIYALGIILYEMLTGRVPYEAETPMAVVFKHIQGDLPLPHTISPNTPEPVERVVLKALAKDPADRYQTAGEMVQALNFAVRTMTAEAQQQTIAEEVAPAQPRQDVSIVTRLQRLWDQPRGKIILASGTIAVLVLLGFLLLQLPGNISILAPNATDQSTSAAVEPTGATTVSSLPATQEELVFEEDFEDAVANVTYIGTDESSWQIVEDGTDNKVFELNNASSTWVGAGFGPSAFTDGAVEYRVKLIDYDLSSDTGSGIATISFRDTPSERYIFALMPFPKRTQLSYADQTTGWIPIDGGFTAYNFEKNTWYTVRLDIQGSKITVYLNGILTSSVEDSRVTTGGLGFSLGPNTVAYFDDIRVWSIPQNADVVATESAATMPSANNSDAGSDISQFSSPVEDVRVRQAIAYCTDRRALTQAVYPTLFSSQIDELVMDSFLLKTHWAYSQPSIQYPFDPGVGQGLLDQAGWTWTSGQSYRTNAQGETLSLSLTTTPADIRKTWTSVFEAQMRSCGIRIINLYLDPNWLFGAGTGATVGDFEMGGWWWAIEDNPDVASIFACESIPTAQNGWQGGNWNRWCNTIASEAAKKATDISLSQSERRQYFVILQEEFAKDLPSLPLFWRTDVNGWEHIEFNLSK